MDQRTENLRNDLLCSEQWREEFARKKRYEEAAYHRDQERLLDCERARLRLRLKLRQVGIKE